MEDIYKALKSAIITAGLKVVSIPSLRFVPASGCGVTHSLKAADNTTVQATSYLHEPSKQLDTTR